MSLPPNGTVSIVLTMKRLEASSGEASYRMAAQVVRPAPESNTIPSVLPVEKIDRMEESTP